MSNIVIQKACEEDVPADDNLAQWASAVLTQFEDDNGAAGEVTLRLVGPEEMRSLNHAYRGKDKLTNVLSFPVEDDIRKLHGLLGDIVICPVVVENEAQAQHKERDAHYAHLVIHGVLHLLGFDHIEDVEATKMEALETRTLATFGIGDPYIENVA